MNVLMVEPGKAPYETQIGDDLQSMQALVGGYIQAVYPYEEPVALICCESGKLDGLTLNRVLRDADGDIYDIVAGRFFIVGLGESDFTDLPHELAEQFAERFRQPEMFMRVDGKIVAAPMPDARRLAAVAVYAVRDARAVPHVRRRDFERASAARRLRRERSKIRRGGKSCRSAASAGLLSAGGQRRHTGSGMFTGAARLFPNAAPSTRILQGCR